MGAWWRWSVCVALSVMGCRDDDVSAGGTGDSGEASTQAVTDDGGETTGEPVPRNCSADWSHEPWAPLPPMAVGRHRPLLVELADGAVLAIGGGACTGPRRTPLVAERLDPGAPAWVPVAAVPGLTTIRAAVTIASGEVLAIGGPSGELEIDDVLRYDPQADSLADAGKLPVTVQSPLLTRFGSDQLLAQS